MFSLAFLLVRMLFSVLFSECNNLTWGRDGCYIYASRAFVCLSRMRYFLSFSLLLGVGSRLRIVIVTLPGHLTFLTNTCIYLPSSRFYKSPYYQTISGS